MMPVQLVTLHMSARGQELSDGLVGLLKIIVSSMSVSDMDLLFGCNCLFFSPSSCLESVSGVLIKTTWAPLECNYSGVLLNGLMVLLIICCFNVSFKQWRVEPKIDLSQNVSCVFNWKRRQSKIVRLPSATHK